MGKLPKVTNPVLDQNEAYDILTWVFGSSKVTAAQLNDTDRGFAQALLMELLDASFKLGFTEALFKASAKITKGARSVIIAFLKGAGKNLVTYKDKDDLKKMMEDPKIYKMALDTLARNFKSVWKIREATGELTY
jgi:hypothetical protein